MWRVFLAFATHRAALYIVALLAINASLAPRMPGDRALPVIQPVGLLERHFKTRIMEVPEVRLLDELRVRPMRDTFVNYMNPYFWTSRLWMGLTGMSAISTVFLLSNLFFFLFLVELYKLLNLIVTTDISRAALYLTVFWPTSYELSLGSSTSLVCLLTTLCIRKAAEQSWGPAGLAAGLLVLWQSWALLLLPPVCALFWYVQRHFPSKVAGLRLIWFAVPVVLALVLGLSAHREMFAHMGANAGGQISSWILSGNFGRLFSGAQMGQMLSLTLFLVGAMTSLFSHANWFYRVMPAFVLAAVVFGTPLDGIASQLLVAAICLEGVASLSSPTVNMAFQAGMWLLGAWEVFNVFR